MGARHPRWLQFIFPEPDVLTMFVMNLTVLALLAADASLRDALHASISQEVHNEGAVMGVFMAATILGFSLWMPFSRFDARAFAYLSVVAHSLALSWICGSRVLSALGADPVAFSDWLLFAYPLGWTAFVLWSFDFEVEVGQAVRSPEQRRREIVRLLVVGAACAAAVVTASAGLSADPLAIYVYAVPLAALLHGVLHGIDRAVEASA